LLKIADVNVPLYIDTDESQSNLQLTLPAPPAQPAQPAQPKQGKQLTKKVGNSSTNK